MWLLVYLKLSILLLHMLRFHKDDHSKSENLRGKVQLNETNHVTNGQLPLMKVFLSLKNEPTVKLSAVVDSVKLATVEVRTREKLKRVLLDLERKIK